VVTGQILAEFMTTQEKIIELDKIAREIKEFKGLDIAKNCTLAVPGEGNPDAQIMFIGEAPGFNEDRQGRPFVGQAGKLLEKTLKDVLDLGRFDVYITNIVKFRPPDNRDPQPIEIEACRDWLDRQINIIHPKIIATLGRFSMAKFLQDISISRIHGQARYVDINNNKIIIFPMYHPAAALRAGVVMNEFIQDFNKLKSLLGNNQPDIAVVKPEPAKITQTSLF
jgi:DNA polymerase